eukprot:tig00000144_g9063.t1
MAGAKAMNGALPHSEGENGHADPLARALEAFRNGQPICLFDSERREQETDILFPAISLQPAQIRTLRKSAGGLIFMAVPHEVSEMFGLAFLQDIYTAPPVVQQCPLLQHLVSNDIRYDARSAFSLTLNHRETFTGITDRDRCLTVRRFAEVSQQALAQQGTGEVQYSEEAARLLGSEFRTPGHIPLCRESKGGVSMRQGHTELSVAVARLAGVFPVVVGAEMMEPDGDCSLSLEGARKWALANNVPFLEGAQVISAMAKATK